MRVCTMSIKPTTKMIIPYRFVNRTISKEFLILQNIVGKNKVDSNDKSGVINTWKRIWSDEDNHKINRVYDFDFEQYKFNEK